MKKMQCEVCGGKEIRKTADDIFECQNCGTQYSTAEVRNLLIEVTGTVKIDHTEDVENLFKRAQQYMEQGDLSKALEYCNKTLDLEPNNEAVQEMIATIHAQTAARKEAERSEASLRASAVMVVKHTITPDDGVAMFLKALKNAPDVAPDIYKEVEIMSVKQGYYPFCVMDKQFSGTYEGVACYRRKVPYTDYETRTDYHNKNQDGSYRKVQVAVTKYREEIERQNVNGTFLVNHSGVFSTSRKLNGAFTSVEPNKYDKAMYDDEHFDEVLGDDLQRNYFNDVILQQLESMVTAGYNTLKTALTEVRTSEQKSIEGLEIFSGCADAGWEKRMNDAFASQVRDKAGSTVNKQIPGDFSENVHWRWSERYSRMDTVYLPVQIIEYAYRGKFYISAMLLIKGSRVLCSYPCNVELKTTKSHSQKAVAEINKRSFPSGIIILYSFFLGFAICAIGLAIKEGEGFDEITLGMLLFSLVFGLPAIIWHVLWHRKKTGQIRQEMLGGQAAADQIEEKFKTELDNECAAFFKVFTGLASVEQAAAAAKSVSKFSSDVSSIKGRNMMVKVSAGDKKAAASDVVQIRDTNGQELVPGRQYTIRMIHSGAHKLEVCKIIRESCGIGLAAANEIASISHSIVAQNLSAASTDRLAFELKKAGARIDIERA